MFFEFVMLMLVVAMVFFVRIVALAYWEAQIEFDSPWARTLRCWRIKVRQIPKEPTGYHFGLAANTLSAIISNDVITVTFLLLCGLIVVPIGLSEILVYFGAYLLIKVSMIILLFTFEDYLWHIVNPSEEYGFHTFEKKKYPAALGTFWIIPGEYILGICISFVMAILTGWLISKVLIAGEFSVIWMAIAGWIVVVGALIVMTVALTIIMPYIHRKAAKLKDWAYKKYPSPEVLR